ncbi:MAG: DDE-type integrase/transposase/recombinase [Candidatus Aminicenantes bacterium]|nr:DDE-type integrase/transposase/recombinase [Candidatus Aminicenantes bacterium]
MSHYKKREDEHYLKLIRQLCDERPTYGYRRITAVLNRTLRKKGKPGVNHKRVYRIMTIIDLLLQKHKQRLMRLHTGTIITSCNNIRWCSDVFEITCWNTERVCVVFSMDWADREVLSYIATTGGIHRDIIKDLMTEDIEYRFGKITKLPHPIQWLSDNGPAYIARETRNFAHSVGLIICTTPFYSPESNGMAESFTKMLKKTMFVWMRQLPQWFEDYNEYHPHKGLKMMFPRGYIKLIERSF